MTMSSLARFKLKLKKRHRATLKEFDGESTSDGDGPTDDGALVLPSTAKTRTNLLCVSLLDRLCTMYFSDPVKANNLFRKLCKKLRRHRIISEMPLLEQDEMSAVRSGCQLNLAKMVAAITQKHEYTEVNDPASAVGELQCLHSFMPQSMHADGPVLGLRDFISHHTSYFRNGFEIIEKLGRGAYGSVYRVKNKLDGCEYAVKEVRILERDPSLWIKIRREVELLAQLSHRYVVRYYTSWLEYRQIARGKKRQQSALTSSASSSSGRRGNGEESSSQSGGIDYDADSEEALVQESCVVLYIKMELCGCSLSDFIEERNGKLTSSSDVYAVVDAVETAKLAKQLLQALGYIHSRNVIHRDITPKNIFLVTDNEGRKEVKLGDFGLARSCLQNVPMTPDPSARERGSGDEVYDCHTGEIGTTAYASPEQLCGCDYDYKTDLYSVGICLFEMYQPFYTGSERIQSLRERRSQSPLPHNFTHRWPQQAEAICQLTLHDPQQRPSAADVLQKGYTDSKQQVIDDLRAQVQELRRENELKDRVIARKIEIIDAFYLTFISNATSIDFLNNMMTNHPINLLIHEQYD